MVTDTQLEIARDEINRMDRVTLTEILEDGLCIQVYDDESNAVLREAVLVSIDDVLNFCPGYFNKV